MAFVLCFPQGSRRRVHLLKMNGAKSKIMATEHILCVTTDFTSKLIHNPSNSLMAILFSFLQSLKSILRFLFYFFTPLVTSFSPLMVNVICMSLTPKSTFLVLICAENPTQLFTWHFHNMPDRNLKLIMGKRELFPNLHPILDPNHHYNAETQDFSWQCFFPPPLSILNHSLPYPKSPRSLVSLICIVFCVHPLL